MERPPLFTGYPSLVIVLFCCTTISAQQFRINKNTPAERDPVKVSAIELAASIKDAKLLLIAVKDVEVRKRLNELLSKAEGNLAVIQASIFKDHGSVISPNVLSNNAFSDLLTTVEKKTFSNAKSKYLVDFAKLQGPNARRLNSSQVKRLLANIDFDKDRVPAAVALFSITVDRENYLNVVEAFSFESNKKKVIKQLGLKK